MIDYLNESGGSFEREVGKIRQYLVFKATFSKILS